ncbi:MAG: hypothetical protein QOG35_1915, partial [Solirubrobacteraceae bacterium]|nr:hypothetical protein [Solirubrobacteraceae bacterium]
GTDASHKQDLRIARAVAVDSGGRGHVRPLLLIGGIVLLLAGWWLAIGPRRAVGTLQRSEKQL